MSQDVFTTLESEVRFYCRAFPTVFERATGHELFDRDGRRYIDFLAGCGALNYGHNNAAIKRTVLRYLENDGILHAMDMHTAAKAEFMEAFDGVVLNPRKLDYKMQFVGPTGTNAVEAALKLARKVTGRRTFFANHNGDILFCEDPNYAGPGAPIAAGSALLPGRSVNSMLGDAAAGAQGRDGNTWRAARR